MGSYIKFFIAILKTRIPAAAYSRGSKTSDALRKTLHVLDILKNSLEMGNIGLFLTTFEGLVKGDMNIRKTIRRAAVDDPETSLEHLRTVLEDAWKILVNKVDAAVKVSMASQSDEATKKAMASMAMTFDKELEEIDIASITVTEEMKSLFKA